ncbi:hypothetical protein GCM10027569_71580 [Flindersiella endophytica]
MPTDPTRATGRWTYHNVRDILSNPKYTGHMVWNRRARKTGTNTVNAVSEWIWSPKPVHEPLVNLDTFIQVQQIAGHRFGSRCAPGANTKHPQTKHSYRLRTYLFCDLCNRRMYGKQRWKHLYYVCAPKKAYIPPGHPGPHTIFVREDALLNLLGHFLNTHVFGNYRTTLLATRLRTIDADAQREREQQAAALQRSITDTDTKIQRAIRNLELLDNPDPDFVRDAHRRRAELRAHKLHLETKLAELERATQNAPIPGLIDALPIVETDLQLDQLPEETARRLFEALRLKITYNKTTNQATCHITLTAQTITAAQHAAHNAITAQRQAATRKHPANDKDQVNATNDGPGPILVVPPAGHTAEPQTLKALVSAASSSSARSRSRLVEARNDRILAAQPF